MGAFDTPHHSGNEQGLLGKGFRDFTLNGAL
jgi:hypothetical protein